MRCASVGGDTALEHPNLGESPMLRAFTLVAIAALLPDTVLAGPDATVNRLIADPASMLDFGLFRLGQYLQDQKLGSATYDWDTNQIVIYWRSVGENSQDLTEAEQKCSDWVTQVRLSGWVGANGKAAMGVTVFSSFFQHIGFGRSDSIDSELSDIDKLIWLQCYSETLGEKVTVTAPLLGTAYSVQKEPKE